MYKSNRIIQLFKSFLLIAVLFFMVPQAARSEHAKIAKYLTPSESVFFISMNSDTSKIGTKEKVPQWTSVELKKILKEQSASLSAKGGMGKKKNGRIAMLCSLLFPGLGQMYDEKPIKATIAMGIETYYLSQILLNYRYAKREERIRDSYSPTSYHYRNHDIWVEEYKKRVVDWMWWSGGAIFLIVVDAYVDANLYDMRMHVSAEAKGDGVACTFNFAF